MRNRFWTAVLGYGVSLFAPLALVYTSGEWYWKAALAFSSWALLGFVAWLGIYRPVKRFEDKQRRIMDEYLKPFLDGASYDGKKPKLRANIMVATGLLPWKKFRQCYQYKMEGWPDANLAFSVNAGFCGQVFRSNMQDAFYKDLRQLTEEDLKAYKWSDKQARQTKHVKAVISTPIFRKHENNGGGYTHEYFGVVNVDAVDDVGAEYLKDQEVIDKIRSLAQFAQLIFD